MNEKIKKTIAEAMKALNISKRKTVFTAKELEEIAKAAGCQLYCVMYYLRFER